MQCSAVSDQGRAFCNSCLSLDSGYAVELEKRIRSHLGKSNGCWRVDEAYAKVRGRWMYPYRVVSGLGRIIDFLLAAKRFFPSSMVAFRRACDYSYGDRFELLSGLDAWQQQRGPFAEPQDHGDDEPGDHRRGHADQNGPQQRADDQA